MNKSHFKDLLEHTTIKYTTEYNSIVFPKLKKLKKAK